jgi:hypothetical protein
MHVTDSANGFRMGFAICLETDGGPGFNGDMYWLSVDQNGIPISVTPFAGVLGRGWISPAIVSDGFDWSAGSTYWYMTFQDVDTTTGAGTLALLAWSTNWGRTWALDTARSSFNDYELDIEYNFGADSIYVLLTNNLTTTDENLRLRWSALSNLGSSVAFKQFNPATTADHDRLGTVAVNRQTNEMAVMYTKFIGANQDVRLSHAPTGFGVAAAWTLDQTIGGLAGNESRAMIDCHQRQGAYRICYVSSGGSFDTVIYMSTFTLPNFAGRQVVNQTNITAVAPSVVGAGTGAAFNGGVLFATNNALMYDGSAVLTSVEPEGNNIPGAFSL